MSSSKMRLSNLWTEHKKLSKYTINLELSLEEYKEFLFGLADRKRFLEDGSLEAKNMTSLEDKIIEAHNTFNIVG